MKTFRLFSISLILLAFASCENASTIKDDSNSPILNEGNSFDDTISVDNDYQNQEGRRANSDTINQGGPRPTELDE